MLTAFEGNSVHGWDFKTSTVADMNVDRHAINFFIPLLSPFYVKFGILQGA